MSETPRTDRNARAKTHGIVDADFAREIERELATAKQKIEELRGLLKRVPEHLECEICGHNYRCVTGRDPDEYCEPCKLREEIQAALAGAGEEDGL